MNIEGHDVASEELSSTTFLEVTKLSPEQRFDYLLNSIKTTGKIWGLLGKNGWVMVESGNELCLPIWSHPEFVVAWERDDFPECEPASIDIDDFIEKWAPGLDKNNTLLLIFPCGEEEEGIVMSGAEYVECLKEVLPS